LPSVYPSVRMAAIARLRGMVMKMIKIGDRIINPALIAWAIRDGKNSTVAVHFPIQEATAGVGEVSTGTPGHHVERFSGTEAVELWTLLSELASWGGA
jgi:hypothetical protein